ncbi:MAG: transcriptional regulator [Spirochaetes bacterium]|nr:transcriptional regulator [Spirochaetota bacterium]
MNELYTRFDSVFFEKTRLSIVTLLMQQGVQSFNQLKDSLALSDGALYTHMEKLLREDYITKKKEVAGQNVQTVYAMSEKGRKEYLDYIVFLETLIRKTREGS